MLRRAWARTIVVVTAAPLAISACGGREVALPLAERVAAPTFATVPADLADSPQLAAMPLRDTAGLAPSGSSALATELAAAVSAVMSEAEPRPERFIRVSVYDRNVYVSWLDPASPNRSYSAVYYPGDGDGLYVSGPDFTQEESFSLEGVDLTVPARLVSAIEQRFAGDLVATDVDLRVGLSYGFGLVWNISVDDARGHLATVFADLDGAIVAIDS